MEPICRYSKASWERKLETTEKSSQLTKKDLIKLESLDKQETQEITTQCDTIL